MRVKALMIAAAYSLAIVFAATLLMGCEAAREIGKAAYDACRDGLCR